MYNRLIIIVLALLCGVKAFAQEWEWVSGHINSDTAFLRFHDVCELSDGRLLVSGESPHIDGCGVVNYYFCPMLLSLASDGTELALKDFYKEGYFSSLPHVLESPSGAVFMLTAYSPDHDTCSFNYFRNFAPPTDHCVLGLYKLDDSLQITESHEWEIPIDTFEWRSENNYLLSWDCGQIYPLSAFVDDDGSIVGAYYKTVSWNPDEFRGYDTTVFFRMGFDGQMLNEKKYCGEFRSGLIPDELYNRYHIVKADSLYLYYGYEYDVISENRSNLVYLDRDFNVVRGRFYRHPTILHPYDKERFQHVNVKRSRQGMTYMTCVINEVNYDYCSILYEFDDDVEGGSGTVPLVRYAERKTDWVDIPPFYSSVDLLDDNTLYYAYTLHLNEGYQGDSWIVMEHLTPEFDTIATRFYGVLGDGKGYLAHGMKAASDGGLVLVLRANIPYGSKEWYVVCKYPTSAFDGIEEAHANGLKTAIVYPNPGRDLLNIRTGLKNAYVEVYDASGRQVHSQTLMRGVTTIHAEAWPAGMYVWKVYANGKEAESGRWVKQ